MKIPFLKTSSKDLHLFVLVHILIFYYDFKDLKTNSVLGLML